MAAPKEPSAKEPSERVVTAPNAITAARLLCTPLFVWMAFGAHLLTGAAVLLGALGATDWVDGYAARHLGQVSEIGKVIDPVADRLLMVTGVASIIALGAVPVWFGALTLAREALVSGATVLLAALGARRIDVLWVGKAGTFALMFAYPAFLVSYGGAGWQVPFYAFAWFAGAVGLSLAWIAAIAYLAPARAAVAEGRRSRVPAGATPAMSQPGTGEEAGR